MTAELVEGRCHIPLDSILRSVNGASMHHSSGIRRNDGILILITGFGFDVEL
jgi:hypothetical protein